MFCSCKSSSAKVRVCVSHVTTVSFGPLLQFRSVSWCLLHSVCRFRVLFSPFCLVQGVVDCGSLCFIV
jgi:hypothetical protein